jgi:phytoene dehydrogenase-like protein
MDRFGITLRAMGQIGCRGSAAVAAQAPGFSRSYVEPVPVLDAVVVGSGPNGLAAAIALAQAGLRVEVLEAKETIGGGCRTLPLTLPGFRHDHCSAIHPLGIASPFFRRLPLAEQGLRWIHPDVPLAHPFDDGTAAILARSFEDTGATIGPDARAWRALLAPFAEEFEGLVDELLGAMLHVPRRPLLLARFGFSGLLPIASLARARFRGERARALFAGIAAHAQLRFDQAASSAFGLVLGAAAHAVGWPFPEGGAQLLSTALASVLAEHGGRIRTSRLVGSLADVPPAKATLLDVTPRQLLALARDRVRVPARYAAALERFRYGPGSFKVDWALSGPIPWRAREVERAGTVHLGGTLDEMAAAELAVAEGRVPERPFVLLAQHTRFDRSRAPAGRHTAWAYCHVPHGFAGDATAAIEAQIERFAPGFQELVLARSTRSPRALEADNPNLVGGDIGAGSMHLAQLLARPALRVTPWSTPIPGVFLCSASTPPGGGVHGMCGWHAAQAVLSRLGRRARAEASRR